MLRAWGAGIAVVGSVVGWLALSHAVDLWGEEEIEHAILFFGVGSLSVLFALGGFVATTGKLDPGPIGSKLVMLRSGLVLQGQQRADEAEPDSSMTWSLRFVGPHYEYAERRLDALRRQPAEQTRELDEAQVEVLLQARVDQVVAWERGGERFPRA